MTKLSGNIFQHYGRTGKLHNIQNRRWILLISYTTYTIVQMNNMDWHESDTSVWQKLNFYINKENVCVFLAKNSIFLSAGDTNQRIQNI